MPPRTPRFIGPSAALLALALFAVYNANGREIGTYDTQPAKYAARAFAQEGTLRVDREIERTPALAERPAFARDRQGHVRTAYSPIAPLAGGLIATALMWSGVDLDAPRAPNLIAVVTASALTAIGVALLFATMTRLVSPGLALLAAIGLGLGTNLWAVSRTLGQHEVVLFGVALCLFNWTRPVSDITRRHAWVGAIGLALAVTARFQMAPLVLVLLAGLAWRVGPRRAAGPAILVAASLGGLMFLQWHWFGHPLGAMPGLTQLHPQVHAVAGPISQTPWTGLAGLLVSPNRGLFIYSPVVLVALAGLAPALRQFGGFGLGWGFAAAGLQLVAYGAYAVWWGGHTYGPRYALDAIAPLVPAGAIALATVCRGPIGRSVCAAALVWSIVVAGTGAFFTSNWNTSPVDVDRHHERLWDWNDLQIRRAWETGRSPQNFNLFNWTSYRTTPRPEEVLAEAD
ncbi:MAG: hypothetical protein IT183_05320 [Acidobacteria bacterium]|nr:hypothetical protein [Acidobacteriota bacterium]